MSVLKGAFSVFWTLFIISQFKVHFASIQNESLYIWSRYKRFAYLEHYIFFFTYMYILIWVEGLLTKSLPAPLLNCFISPSTHNYTTYVVDYYHHFTNHLAVTLNNCRIRRRSGCHLLECSENVGNSVALFLVSSCTTLFLFARAVFAALDHMCRVPRHQPLQVIS